MAENIALNHHVGDLEDWNEEAFFWGSVTHFHQGEYDVVVQPFTTVSRSVPAVALAVYRRRQRHCLMVLDSYGDSPDIPLYNYWRQR